MDLKTLKITPEKLPAVPRVALEVIASFSQADVHVDRIASLIELDPVLSAKLLWLANSSYFHVSKSIGSVKHAIHILGFAMVRNLVLGSCVAGAYRSTCGVDLPLFWRYNLYTACAARWLAVRCRIDADVTFTLGLVHALGELQMHVMAPAALASLNQQMSVVDPRRATFEVETLGWSYLDVSAELAKYWNFPDTLVRALRSIHHPLEGTEFFAPAACVHLGAWRARVALAGSTQAELLAAYPQAVAARLGLDASWLHTPAAAGADDHARGPAMPSFNELTHGLENLFT